MKAAVFHRINKISVDNVPDPGIEAADDIIVRVTSTAICVHYGTRPDRGDPYRLYIKRAKAKCQRALLDQSRKGRTVSQHDRIAIN